jgi:ATP synthase protein I
MATESDSTPSSRQVDKAALSMAAQVAAKAQRKRRAQRHPTQSVWMGLGLMGVVGWSVVVPTLAGAALGQWLDQHYPGGRSWTLALLVAGLTLGCLNAWRWVAKEDDAMHDKEEPTDDT